MFAMCLGHANGDRRQLPAGKKHATRREVVTESDFAVLKALAIARSNGLDVLLQLHDVLAGPKSMPMLESMI